jgi:hypothetical protein
MPLDLFAKGEPRSKAAMERAMKVQEVILRAISKQIRWFEGARILGLSGRQLGRLYYRYRTPFFSLASFDFLCKDR